MEPFRLQPKGPEPLPERRRRVSLRELASNVSGGSSRGDDRSTRALGLLGLAVGALGALTGSQELLAAGTGFTRGVFEGVEERKKEEFERAQAAREEELRQAELALRQRQLGLEEENLRLRQLLLPYQIEETRASTFARFAGVPTEEERRTEMELKRAQAEYYKRLATVGPSGRQTQAASEQDVVKEATTVAALRQGLGVAWSLAEQARQAIARGQVLSAQGVLQELNKLLDRVWSARSSIITRYGYEDYLDLLNEYNRVLMYVRASQQAPAPQAGR